MTYTEHLDRLFGIDSISGTEIAIYTFLLHRCNSCGWPETFSLSLKELEQRLKSRRNTIVNALAVLEAAGLIHYNIGNGRGNKTTFSITERVQNSTPLCEKRVQKSIPLCEKRVQNSRPLEAERVQNSRPLCENNSVSGSKSSSIPERVQNSTPLCDAQSKKKQKNKEKTPPAPPIKKEKNKKETAHPLTTGAHTHTCENGQTEIVFNELKEKPLKKKRELVEPILPESMDEVVSFFEKKAASKLPKWKEEAEIFFYHFESIGWAGTYGRKIHDWKAKANLWICDRVLELQKQKSNQNGTTINNTSNERAASDIEAAELVERLLRENELESEGVPGAVQP